MRLRIGAALAVSLALAAPAALALGSGEGRYYPKPKLAETYASPAFPLPDAGRRQRVTFVTAATNLLLQRPYATPYSFTVMGEDAEELIIVGFEPERLATPFRVRAYLSLLTAVARTNPLFIERGVDDSFTFLDLLKLLNFKRVIFSDGRDFAYRIDIE